MDKLFRYKEIDDLKEKHIDLYFKVTLILTTRGLGLTNPEEGRKTDPES